MKILLVLLMFLSVMFGIDSRQHIVIPISGSDLNSYVVTNNYKAGVALSQLHVTEIVFPDGTIATSASTDVVLAGGISNTGSILIHADTLDSGSGNITLKFGNKIGLIMTSQNTTMITLNSTFVNATALKGEGSQVTGVITSDKSLTANVALNSLLLNNQIASQMSVSTANIGLTANVALKVVATTGTFSGTLGITGQTTMTSLTVNGVASANDFIASNLAYGGYGISYNAKALTISVAEVYVTLNTGIIAGTLQGISVSSNGEITVLVAGLYLVDGSFTMTGTNGNELQLGYSVNGVTPRGDDESGVTAAGASSYVRMTIPSSMQRLAVGDRVTVRIENESAAANVTVKWGRIRLVRIAP